MDKLRFRVLALIVLLLAGCAQGGPPPTQIAAPSIPHADRMGGDGGGGGSGGM
jgi:hypothetical protein